MMLLVVGDSPRNGVFTAGYILLSCPVFVVYLIVGYGCFLDDCGMI